MVSIAHAVTEREGVTLVTARIEGDDRPRRVRLESRLDGPLWPPRVEGTPAPGWDDAGVTRRVPPGAVVGVGFASPAPPSDPPVDVTACDPATGDRVGSATTAALVELGDPRPPRDAVPETGAPGELTDERRSASTDRDAPAGTTAEAALPGDVQAWLEAVDERVAAAEQLATAESVPDATAALRETDGLDGARSLVDDVDADAAALAAVARRADALADRAASVDVPFETLERIA